MKYDEFIEFIDEIIEYDKIVAEYGLTYSQIDMAINHMKTALANKPLPDSPPEQSDSGDPKIVCPDCYAYPCKCWKKNINNVTCA